MDFWRQSYCLVMLHEHFCLVTVHAGPRVTICESPSSHLLEDPFGAWLTGLVKLTTFPFGKTMSFSISFPFRHLRSISSSAITSLGYYSPTTLPPHTFPLNLHLEPELPLDIHSAGRCPAWATWFWLHEFLPWKGQGCEGGLSTPRQSLAGWRLAFAGVRSLCYRS